MIGRGDVERTVDHERRALDRDVVLAEVERAGSADINGCAAAASAPAESAGSRRHLGAPREREVLHGELIDLLERAVALAAVIARVGRPRLAERFQQLRGIQALALPAQERRQQEERTSQRYSLQRHFTVTRYAVRSWMSLSV